MNHSIAHRITEVQSEIRRIKEGWYAMDDHGHLGAGPFTTRDKCLERIEQPMNPPMPFGLWQPQKRG